MATKLNQSVLLSVDAQEQIIQYYKKLASGAPGEKLEDNRKRFEAIDRQYLRESDRTKEGRQANRKMAAGDITVYENIEVPVIKPKVDAQVGYQAAVFLSNYPIFEVTSPPEHSVQGKQLQAIIEENSTRTGWLAEFLLFFHAGARYNDALIEVAWEERLAPAVETNLSYSSSQGKPVMDVVWAGNNIRYWDGYNSVVDTRCTAKDFPSQGEFAINTMPMSPPALKTFLQSLPNRIIPNLNKAFDAPSHISGNSISPHSFSYFSPDLRRDNDVDIKEEDEDWAAWLGMVPELAKGRGIKGAYELTRMYLRLIPAHFGMNVPAKNTPQIWLFYIVNHEVLVSAERMNNAHNMIPVFRARPAEDGLGHNTKSLAENVAPFQRLTTALLSSIVNARRRAIFDRLAYDPSRINKADIESPNPAARIRVRPSAYGKPISDALFHIPFRDDQSQIGIAEVQQLQSMADSMVGQNPARQGQFVPGNKTDGQWQDVMRGATSSDQLTAWVYETNVMTPMKEVIKLNILQYQASGTIYSMNSKEVVKIDPVALRQATLHFKISDGLTPKEKMMALPERQAALQIIGSSPTLAQVYNIAPMFSYLMREGNADLKPFEKSGAQVAYEQAVQQWSQLAQLAIQKQAPFNVPQPVPQQFGYDPNQQIQPSGGPAAEVTRS